MGYFQFPCRAVAAFPLAGVDHSVWQEVVLQPFYRLVRTNNPQIKTVFLVVPVHIV